MATRQTNMRLDVELIEKYKALGRENDRDASYYMRKALEAYVGGKVVSKVVTSEKAIAVVKPAFNPKDFCFDGLNVGSWCEWCDYRKSKRKPISELAAKKQFKMLCEYDLETQKEIIDLSIQNDYAGLFPPKYKAGTDGAKQDDAINSNGWAEGLGDLIGQQDHGGLNGELPGVEEFGCGQQGGFHQRLQAPVAGGDDREQCQLGFDGQDGNGQG